MDLDEHGLTYDVFMNERCDEPCAELVAARWAALSPTEQHERQTSAFEIVCDDSVELEDYGAHEVFQVEAQPELWWTHTQTGRRTVEALTRLQVVFEHERAIGDLEAAWQTIEAAAAFFGLGVWLKQEQPVNLDESSWVRPLLERCNSVPWLLVPFYLHDASDEELKLCHRLTIAEVTRTFGPGRKVELFRLACEGHVLPDPALVEAVVELARFAQIELDAAVPARQERRAAAAIRIGAAALDVFSRLCDDSVEG